SVSSSLSGFQLWKRYIKANGILICESEYTSHFANKSLALSILPSIPLLHFVQAENMLTSKLSFSFSSLLCCHFLSFVLCCLIGSAVSGRMTNLTTLLLLGLCLGMSYLFLALLITCCHLDSPPIFEVEKCQYVIGSLKLFPSAREQLTWMCNRISLNSTMQNVRENHYLPLSRSKFNFFSTTFFRPSGNTPAIFRLPRCLYSMKRCVIYRINNFVCRSSNIYFYHFMET
ncbi:hypothetical protein L9F63_002499, partial [Diploptera punctata]